MPTTNIDLADSTELAEMLQFLRDWFTADHTNLDTSLATFLGTSGYDVHQLRADLDRFTFLLGANDGEALFKPEPD
jgi:hypothetical protein